MLEGPGLALVSGLMLASDAAEPVSWFGPPHAAPGLQLLLCRGGGLICSALRKLLQFPFRTSTSPVRLLLFHHVWRGSKFGQEARPGRGLWHQRESAHVPQPGLRHPAGSVPFLRAALLRPAVPRRARVPGLQGVRPELPQDPRSGLEETQGKTREPGLQSRWRGGVAPGGGWQLT